jgi:hypothetical protein
MWLILTVGLLCESSCCRVRVVCVESWSLIQSFQMYTFFFAVPYDDHWCCMLIANRNDFIISIIRRMWEVESRRRKFADGIQHYVFIPFKLDILLNLYVNTVIKLAQEITRISGVKLQWFCCFGLLVSLLRASFQKIKCDADGSMNQIKYT